MEYCYINLSNKCVSHASSSYGLDGALQCPLNSNAGDDDFNNHVIDNWTGCDIMGSIVEEASTLPNPVIGIPKRQKRRRPNNNDISFTNDDEEDLIVETDSNDDILYQMYVLYLSYHGCVYIQ